MEFLSKNLADTKRLAAEFLDKIATEPRSRAALVGLYGDLGSGKTTFVQAAALALGVKAHIASPTFLLLKSYALHASHYTFLHHVDAYRLKSGEELSKLGFPELLRDPSNLIFVEWADRVADVLPPDHMQIRFEFIDDSTRAIVFP